MLRGAGGAVLLGRVYVADDLGEFHLPLRNFYAEQLARGEPFDWMPSLYGGFYVAAEGQLGALSSAAPAAVSLAAAGRGVRPGAVGQLSAACSPACICFVRRLVGRRDAALFGALVFTFCGFNLLHFVHPNAVAIVAHIPWLLLAIDVALSTDSASAAGRGRTGDRTADRLATAAGLSAIRVVFAAG